MAKRPLTLDERRKLSIMTAKMHIHAQGKRAATVRVLSDPHRSADLVVLLPASGDEYGVLVEDGRVTKDDFTAAQVAALAPEEG